LFTDVDPAKFGDAGCDRGMGVLEAVTSSLIANKSFGRQSQR